MAHDAFISYNHGADGELAPALERALERLAKPWYALRALDVFRDQSDLALTPHLWETIRVTIDGSKHFVAMLCPESVASPWVRQELAHWVATRGTDGLLLVVTGGTITWDPATGDFAADATAVPPELRGVYLGEPLYEDLREAKSRGATELRDPAFRAAVARLASPMHGVAPADLEGEDVRLRRRARRLARLAVVGLVLLAVVSTVASVVAVRRAADARDRAREATARSTALALLDLPISRVDEALVGALLAAQQDPGNPDRFRSALALVGRYPRLVRLLPIDAPAGVPAVVSRLAVADDGRVGIDLLTIEDGAPQQTLARVGPDGAPVGERVTLGVDTVFVSFLGDRPEFTWVGATSVLRVADALGAVREVEGTTKAMHGAIDRAVVVRNGSQLLIEVSSGAVLADLGPDRGAPAAFTRDVLATSGPAGPLLVDPLTGTLLATASAEHPVVGLFASSSGDTVVTIEAIPGDAVLRRWDRDADRLVPRDTTFSVPAESTSGGVLSPSGDRLLAVGSTDHVIVDTASGSVVARPVGALPLFDVSGRFLATGGNRFTLWDVESAETVFAAPEPVKVMAWSSGCDRIGGRCRLATVGAGLVLWDPVDRVRTVLAEEINAEAVAVSSDGELVASGGWGRTVALWSARLVVDDRPPEVVVAAGAGARGGYDAESGLVAVADGGAVVVGDPAQEDGDLADTVALEADGSADDVVLLAGGARAMVREEGGWALVDAATGTSLGLDARCSADLWAADPSGSHVAALERASGVLAVCRADDGSFVANADIGDGVPQPSAIAVDELGSVVVGGVDSFAIYSLVGTEFTPGAAVLTAFGGETAPVSSVSFSTGRIALGLIGADPSDDRGVPRGRVVVWDVLSGTEPISYDVDEREVIEVRLLADGSLLATAARDAEDSPITIQLWDTSTRRRLGRSLGGLSGDITLLTGSPTALVAGDTSGRVLRWTVATDPVADVCDILGAPFGSDRLALLGLDEVDDPCRSVTEG